MSESKNNFESKRYKLGTSGTEDNIKFLYNFCSNKKVIINRLCLEEWHDLHYPYNNEVMGDIFTTAYPKFEYFRHRVLTREYKDWKIGCEIRGVKYMVLGCTEENYITVTCQKGLLENIEDIILEAKNLE